HADGPAPRASCRVRRNARLRTQGPRSSVRPSLGASVGCGGAPASGATLAYGRGENQAAIRSDGLRQGWPQSLPSPRRGAKRNRRQALRNRRAPAHARWRRRREERGQDRGAIARSARGGPRGLARSRRHAWLVYAIPTIHICFVVPLCCPLQTQQWCTLIRTAKIWMAQATMGRSVVAIREER